MRISRHRLRSARPRAVGGAAAAAAMRQVTNKNSAPAAGRAGGGQLIIGANSEPEPLVVAIVGAGPSGIYAAEALSQQTDVAVEVAVIDRLPVPFGLVRYGVAPDHDSIRSIRNTLERTLERPSVRFYGDVAIGADLSVDELRESVDCVIYAYGAGTDRGWRSLASGWPEASRPPSWSPGTAATPTSIPIPTSPTTVIISWQLTSSS